MKYINLKMYNFSYSHNFQKETIFAIILLATTNDFKNKRLRSLKQIKIAIRIIREKLILSAKL